MVHLRSPAESGGPGPELMRGTCANLVANPLSRFLTFPLPAHKVLGFLSPKDPRPACRCGLSSLFFFFACLHIVAWHRLGLVEVAKSKYGTRCA
jgi:hypothetical protein